MLAAEREEVVAETDGELSAYTIEATLDPGSILPPVESESAVAEPAASPAMPDEPGAPPEAGTPAIITGALDLRYVNDTGSDLSKIYLRLYANDERYTEGGIELANVAVDGQTVAPELSVNDTVAELALPEPLAEGDATEVSLEFTTTVIQSFDFFSSMFNLVPETGTLSLAHWYPILAGHDPEAGWVLDPVSMNGDLVFSNTALYHVTVTAPDDVALVTSGSMVTESAAGDSVQREYITGPAREFTVMVDNDFASMWQEVDGTTLTVWYNPGHEAGAEAILTYGAQALTTFNEHFGAYPFNELDLVESQLGGPGGIEYSQLIGLDTILFEDPAMLEEQGFPPHLAEYITAHEVAHQWWYGLVGNNNYAHAFLDEAMAETSTIIYFEHEYDMATAEQQELLNLSSSFAFQYAISGDQVVDQPTDAFPTGGAYFGAVYGKGAMGFLAIRDAIGAEAFAEGLQTYVAQMRFGVAAPDDLRMALESASNQGLEELWKSWFETAGDRLTIDIELDADPIASPAP